jgi:hypothetical protein
MKLIVTLTIASTLALAPNAWPQSVAGTFVGETSGEVLAPRPLTVVLKDDGTGTMDVGEVQDLIDLEIDGNAVSFGFRPRIFGNPANFLFRYRGEVDSEKMTIYATVDNGDGAALEYSDVPLVLMRQEE